LLKIFALHLPLPLGLSRPPVVNFEREGICTTSLKISPKVSRLRTMKLVALCTKIHPEVTSL
jgi:hypothetical protein